MGTHAGLSPQAFRPAAFVAIIAVFLVAACGSSEKGTSRASATQTSRTRAPVRTANAEVASLLGGIPQQGSILGDPKAPVTLEYFGDLQCPYCRQFTLDVLPLVIQRYVRVGKLKIQYRSFESATADPGIFKAQQTAALAAGLQDKLWHYVELFYREAGRENSGYVTERYLQGLAQQVPGLNLVAWTAARSDPALAHTLIRDEQTAFLARFRGTPSFLIGRTGGRFWRFDPRSSTRVRPFTTAIEELLRFGHPVRRGIPSAPGTTGVARPTFRLGERPREYS